MANYKLNKHIVKCPHCNSEYLHQSTVNVFNRMEDSTTGLHVTVTDNDVNSDTNIVDNPSPRRQGVSINLKCEECLELSILHIYQHKGQTMFECKSL